MRYRVNHFTILTLGGAVAYHVALSPWRRGAHRLSIMRVVLDLTGY